MLKNPEAEALMQNARRTHAEAVRLIDAGDWRNASENGWLAVRAAAAALVLEVTGVHHDTSTEINAAIRRLAQERGNQWVEIRNEYASAAHCLHSEAFYDGVYNDDLADLVREVADYIQRAETLAAIPTDGVDQC